ncbi:MAG TPA: SRPBCC domain-containing protein [Solirubrobacteraceae bacterium]|jgi:uncharacterized protein YndB with AHSA1/START domain
MNKATLIIDGTRPAVRLERRLADPPAIVWQALTDGEQLRAWFPCDVVLEGGRWEVGAALTFPFPPELIDMTLSGEVLVVDEPHRLAFTWGEEVLRFELHAEDSGTRLVLIDELPAAFAARNAAGWEVCLDRLDGHQPAENAWRASFDAYSRAFEPTLGSQQGPPAEYKGD